MAAEILLRAEEARDHAVRMRTAADNVRETFTSLRSELNSLSESFRGQAQTAFESRFTEWDTGANQVLESLEGLSAWLTQAADTLETVDTDMGSQLSGS